MTFRTREQEAAVGLLRTTDAIRRHFSAIVAPHGITLQQYNVLRILRGAGRDGLPTLAIGERMVEKTPGVTRLIDRLVKKGFVIRRPCDEDRRRVYCHITPLGLKLVGSLGRAGGPRRRNERCAPRPCGNRQADRASRQNPQSQRIADFQRPPPMRHPPRISPSLAVCLAVFAASTASAQAPRASGRCRPAPDELSDSSRASDRRPL